MGISRSKSRGKYSVSGFNQEKAALFPNIAIQRKDGNPEFPRHCGREFVEDDEAGHLNGSLYGPLQGLLVIAAGALPIPPLLLSNSCGGSKDRRSGYSKN
jgi:hypothetical protein